MKLYLSMCCSFIQQTLWRTHHSTWLVTLVTKALGQSRPRAWVIVEAERGVLTVRRAHLDRRLLGGSQLALELLHPLESIQLPAALLGEPASGLRQKDWEVEMLCVLTLVAEVHTGTQRKSVNPR